MNAFSLRDFKGSMLRMHQLIMKRSHLFALVVLSIILRIPRAPGIIGDDGFVVLWMGLALSQGHWEIWATSPISIIGLHPYTPGPIGIPLIIAAFLQIGFSYEAIVLIISIASGVVGTVGAYALGNELFATKTNSFLFAIFYSCSHVFMRFTNFTITQRGPFLAVLPWFLLYCVMTIRSASSGHWTLTRDGLVSSTLLVRRYALFSIMLYLMLLLLHGLAVFLVLYAFVVIGYYVLKKMKNIVGSRLSIGRFEEASDPRERILIEEKTMPQDMLEEIQTTMAWLKVLPELIGEMEDALLMTVKEELVTAYKLYSEAFRDDRFASSRAESGYKLKMVFLERIRNVINQVNLEIESRLSEGHTIPIGGSTRSISFPDFDESTHDEKIGRRIMHVPKLIGNKVKSMILSSNFISWVVFVVLMGGAYYVGTRLLPIQSAKTAPLLGLSNSSIIGLSINLIADYGIRLGLWSVFLPIGVLCAFYRDRGHERRLIHYILVPGVLFVLPISTYSSVLFLPVFAYYSVIGFDMIRSSINTGWVGVFSVAFLFTFSLSYEILVVLIPFWILVLIALVLLFSVVTVVDWLRRWYSYRTLVGRNLRRWKLIVGRGTRGRIRQPSMLIFIVCIIIISLITTEGVLLQSENVHLTNDEMRIIDFLGTQSAPGITFVPTPVIGRRLEAYGFPAVLSYNDGAALYFGWTSLSNVTSSCYWSPFDFLDLGTFYTAEEPTPERTIFNSVFNTNLTNYAEYMRAKENGLEFVIVEKNGTGYSSMFHSVYGETFSTLLNSAPLACELAVDGQQMSLFRLS